MSEPISGSSSFGSSSISSKLPDKPSGEFLRKLAKDRLGEMRRAKPAARLFEAQLLVARKHGFGSWREMIAHLNLGRRGNVRRENGRVEIEEVAPLTWDGGNCTYLAALANALRVIDPNHDYVRLFGDSALAFRMRFWANDAGTASCPSSPVGEMPPWTDFTERSIGWKMRHEVRLSDSSDDPNDMSDQLDQLVASIDSGLPVLGYFKSLDVGIVYGYQGTKLLVRDFHLGKDGVVDIAECRGWFAYFEQRTTVPRQEESARSAIAEAISRWSHSPTRATRNNDVAAYYYGADAYGKWIKLLGQFGALTPNQQKSLLHVNYWAFISLHDARQKAALYLRSIAGLFPQSADALRRAAELYQQIGEMTGMTIHDGSAFLPFYRPDSMNKWTPAVRKKEIELLGKVHQLDQEAITQLGRSI